MSAERDSDEAIQVAVDIDGDAVEIERERIETVRVDQLFRPVEEGNCDARLQLWSDSAGWNGYERRGDQYYHVNVLTRTIVEGTEVTVESEYIHEEAVPAEDVAESVRDHILDRHAGGVGTFVRGCSPP
ncbi:hypothetical protein DJ82_12270 [Halorubrum sp. Ib24]|uniref:hypothetical protein n=1 Tax=Halorubrum sp. Ib24 TaxID=1383850 RepID=UPI000B9908B1|nr:hypothetical protein [Halorubrum sp. Ib24]OYR38353.1 hypothetical protein DJ82_12270 [Halorubrum sp. Ib24]